MWRRLFTQQRDWLSRATPSRGAHCCALSRHYYTKSLETTGMISGGRSGVSKVMSIAGLLVSSALLIHTSSRQRPVECASTAKIERDYRSEGALIELLTNIRGTLDQVSSGPIQVSSRDEVYIAVVHRDFIRIQLVSVEIITVGSELLAVKASCANFFAINK
jgi:hypothetical protein